MTERTIDKGQTQHIVCNAVTKAGEGDRVLDFTITTPTPDRSNDVVVVSGGRFDAYRKNPIVLWSHRWGDPPIAKALDLRPTETGIQSRAQFASVEEIGELGKFSDSIYRMYLEGYLSAISIGFRVHDYEWDQDRRGADFTDWTLLEYSCVPIPQNPEALIAARGAGIDTAPIATWAAKIIDELPVDDLVKRSVYEKAWKHSRPTDDERLYAIVKRAIGEELIERAPEPTPQTQTPAGDAVVLTLDDDPTTEGEPVIVLALSPEDTNV